MWKEPTLMNNPRNQYTYKLIGQIRHKKRRKKPQHPQYFWQLNITCENQPQIKKIFAFKAKLSPENWTAIEQNSFLGKTYCFSCRNYQGHYYLIHWEESKGDQHA